MVHILRFSVLWLLLTNCSELNRKERLLTKDNEKTTINDKGVSIIVLGTVQDAGSPHIACKKECCSLLFSDPSIKREVVSLGLIDSENQKKYLFEATPDITTQIKALKKASLWDSPEIPDGIFLTHAHIGHYSGLMYLGKEATNTDGTPVFVMPKMKLFLEENGPWGQLVNSNNIDLNLLADETNLKLTSNIRVIPLLVPHRDEYSETVGYKIIGPNKTALFIPDINKWSVWKTNISDLIKTVDFAFVDATFFDGEEINTRDISEIPHPFVIESMGLFKNLSAKDKRKVHFIHFNHTNPLLKPTSKQTRLVLEKGFSIARKGQIVKL